MVSCFMDCFVNHHDFFPLQDLNTKTQLTATNGAKKPAMEVFSHALRFFKEHALQELSDQSATKILNEDVRWVITVPAIWKQPAKQFMRQAAYQVSDCIASLHSVSMDLSR